MKTQGNKIAEKTINASGIKVTVEVKNYLEYYNYLLDEIKRTAEDLQSPYSADSNMTTAQYFMSKQTTLTVDELNTWKQEQRKRVKKLVKIAVEDTERLNYTSYEDRKAVIKMVTDEILLAIEDDRTSTEIVAIAHGILNANNLIEADTIANIRA